MTSTKIIIATISIMIALVVIPVKLYSFGIPHFDKFAHFGATALMVAILTQFISIRKSVLVAFLIFTSAEIFQIYIPNRSASFLDFAANTAGILTAWFVCKKTNLISWCKSRTLKQS